MGTHHRLPVSHGDAQWKKTEISPGKKSSVRRFHESLSVHQNRMTPLQRMASRLLSSARGFLEVAQKIGGNGKTIGSCLIHILPGFVKVFL